MAAGATAAVHLRSMGQLSAIHKIVHLRFRFLARSGRVTLPFPVSFFVGRRFVVSFLGRRGAAERGLSGVGGGATGDPFFAAGAAKRGLSGVPKYCLANATIWSRCRSGSAVTSSLTTYSGIGRGSSRKC